LLWARAEQILPRKRVGDFNSALMELGALVCTPRSPRCLVCPVNKQCGALAAGLVDQIPPPKKAKPTPLLHRWTFCIRSEDRYLIEQRPATGRWAGMWQFVTIEPVGNKPSVDLMDSQFSLRTSAPKLIGKVEHALTHRRYRFEVFGCETRGSVEMPVLPRKWVTFGELDQYPLPRPHVKIVEMLQPQ
jgi:A/G-specific adenine glycosylase